MQNLTSNQFYGGMNRRWENRRRLLEKFGFQYVRTEFDTVVFARKVPHRTKWETLPTEFVMHANNRSWLDKLSYTLKRG